MANFNNTTKGKSFNKITNHEGEIVHRLSPIEVLFSKVLGSFFGEKTFYEKRDVNSEFTKMVEAINQIPLSDKEYALKIAALGRYLGMIDYPLQILTACFNMPEFKGDVFKNEDGSAKIPAYADEIIRRAKDINTILASHFAIYGGASTMPAQMRKSLRKKLESFDKYKLSKGLDKNSVVSLSDAIKVLHPVPANEVMSAFYKDIMEDKVKFGNDKVQIQTALTNKGKQKDKADNKELKDSIYNANLFAIVKNLVNFVKNGVFDDAAVLTYITAKLRNKKDVLNSKMLPFRYYSAYMELSKMPNTRAVIELKEALEDALDISIEVLDEIEGNTAVLIDVSSSMTGNRVSEYSAVSAAEIAVLLGVIAYKRGYGDLYAFNEDCIKVAVSRRTPVIEIMKIIRYDFWGGSTNLNRALEVIRNYCNEHGLKYDNLIILSDGDCYGYDKRTNTLTICDKTWRGIDNSADKQLDRMFSEGIIKKFWINNLVGNEFAVANTNSHRKNLITGYTEKFVNMINIYNSLGTGKDIRKVIDIMLEREREVKDLRTDS